MTNKMYLAGVAHPQNFKPGSTCRLVTSSQTVSNTMVASRLGPISIYRLGRPRGTCSGSTLHKHMSTTLFFSLLALHRTGELQPTTFPSPFPWRPRPPSPPPRRVAATALGAGDDAIPAGGGLPCVDAREPREGDDALPALGARFMGRACMRRCTRA